jgi:1A family penicillin-binding protein
MSPLITDRWRARVSRHPRLLVTATVLLALGVWAVAGALVWFAVDVTQRLPGNEEIRGIGDMAQATTLYDAKDQPAFTIFKEQRIEVPLDQISPNLIHAVLSVEDQRFYDHRGVDVVRLLGAVVTNVRAGRAAQGGSTITQQLARQSFLGLEKTYTRKLKEAILAARIENAYSKREILELYLNKVYFGDGFYGVEAAARGFFGKSAAELIVPEAALLAGLIQSPSTFAPTINLDRALARRAIVLRTMVDSGAIDGATFEQAKDAPVHLRNSLRSEETFGLYFKEQVRRELVDRFGWQQVYEGGLRVFTTVDAEMQKAADTLVEQSLGRIESRPGYRHEPRGEAAAPAGESPQSPHLQAALVAIEPRTGYVRAMVGGRSFSESRFNRATQARRQPGSAFKPLVFAAAIENGYTPATVLGGLDDPLLTPQGAWLPEEGNSRDGEMTVRAALRTSSNRAAVHLLRSVGLQTGVEYASRFSGESHPSVPSLALGSSEVTVQGLTAAYAAFAHGGLVPKPILIRRVEDRDGTVLFESQVEARRVISETTAFLMTSMLSDVITRGTGWRVRREGFTRPAAGKTGTTNDYFDAWFVGFTPHLVTGVWVGFDQPKTIMANGYGGELATPLWAAFMKVATREHKPDRFSRPEGIVGAEVCSLSGKLPNRGCHDVEVVSDDGEVGRRSLVYTEFFARGTTPREICELHSDRSFFDRVAGVFRDDKPAQVDGKELEGAAAAPGRGTPSTAPERPSDSAAPAADAARPGAGAGVEPEEPQRRRGFWRRVFGLGPPRDQREPVEEQTSPDRGSSPERPPRSDSPRQP